ncbi:MAG: Nif3-like dinuclear metal center hexameric protein [Ignavibacteriaceae bacterium]|nr:Nif3-like dinuclear metal center hexameric protein [Ignavibacteriaceae bacterium]
MTCNDIIKYIESWAPKETAWQKDNVGLQAGAPNREVSNILLSLEVTPPVLEQAIRQNCNLIITHHPFIFTPIKTLNFDHDTQSIILQTLIKNDITLYSAHTNLDFTKDGVSFILAKKLGLQKINFLTKLKSNQFKLSVNVPVDAVDKVADAIFAAGGGIVGEYSGCSFRQKGLGTFYGSSSSNPKRGNKEKFERVDEFKLEIVVYAWKLNAAVKALKAAHPYEEPAFDVLPLENENPNHGAGAIGEFEIPLKIDDFFSQLKKNLKLSNFRYATGKSKTVKKVAVCGGSGSDLFNEAVKAGADVFVTADIKYHTFHDAVDKIWLIDAGHYETEIHVLNEMERRLKNLTKENRIKIFKYKGSTNPILFYNKEGVN